MMESIYRQISACNKCLLRRHSSPVLPVGPLTSSTLVIEGNPVITNPDSSDPVCEASRKYLFSTVLPALGFFRNAVTVTAATKCIKEGSIPVEAIQSCIPFIKDELKVHQPQTIIVLGAIAWGALSSNRMAFSQVANNVFWANSLQSVVVVLFHPKCIPPHVKEEYPKELAKMSSLIKAVRREHVENLGFS